MVVTTEGKNNISVKKTSKRRVLKKNGTTKEKIVIVKKSPIAVDHLNSISKSVGFSCVIMTIVVVAITPSNTWILGPVIGAMAIFGIAMGYFSSK